jgi:hypothetical protein
MKPAGIARAIAAWAFSLDLVGLVGLAMATLQASKDRRALTFTAEADAMFWKKPPRSLACPPPPDDNRPARHFGGDHAKKARELAAKLLMEGYSLEYVRRVGLSMTVLGDKD